MLQSILRKLRFWNLLSQEPEKNSNEPQDLLLSPDLEKSLAALRKILGNSMDVVIREFIIGAKTPKNAALIFYDGLINNKTLHESIMQPLMSDARISKIEISSLEDIQKSIISVGELSLVHSLDEIVSKCLFGDTILLVQGFSSALAINIPGWESRGIQEPPTEAVVRGPREGFTETLRTNMAMIRRKISHPDLTFDIMIIGKRTHTQVSIAYLKGLTNGRLVEEIKRRLKQIDTDAILESGYIEEFIEDAPLSPFATVANSEKPDIVAAKILEGRAAILVDGTPIVLTVPMLFVESFQSPEDYYSRPYYASLVRSLRFIAFTISILGPGTYVALTTYHQELIPSPLLLTMASAREGTPFPALLEALGMGIVFEILREAGVRLPRPVGQAISIVGALVIGDAAVSAGLIGAPMVIVVALTAIASFVVPAQADVGSILRILLTLLAGVVGAFGIVIGLLAILIHLASLRSFGAAYLSPLAPLKTSDLKDVFVRAPLWAMFTRPRSIGQLDPERQKFRLQPEPPEE